MAHWEKVRVTNFLIFHKIAVLWCCKAQSHLSFYLKTNVKLRFISAKWKRNKKDTDSHSHGIEQQKSASNQTSAAQQGTASPQRSQTSGQNSRNRQFLLTAGSAATTSPWQCLTGPQVGAECGFPPSHPPCGHLWAHPLLQKTMADQQLWNLTGKQANSKKLQGPACSLHRDFWAGGLFWFWQSCWVPTRECPQKKSPLNSPGVVLDLQRGTSPLNLLTTEKTRSQQRLSKLTLPQYQTLIINFNLQMSAHRLCSALKISTQPSKGTLQGLPPR